jgi:hypothetical protein
MSTFIRTSYPFKVQASIDSSTPDFEVSTNGVVKAPALAATSLTFTNLVVNALISASVSVKVTAAGFFTLTDSAGNVWRIPAFTTLA